MDHDILIMHIRILLMKKKINSDPVAGFTVAALFCPLSSCCNWHIDMQGKGGDCNTTHSSFPLQAQCHKHTFT